MIRSRVKQVDGLEDSMRAIGALVLVVLTSFAPLASACDLPDMRTSDRPGQDIGPVEIRASILVLDVLGVDDVNQQLELDMRATFRWRDTRLAGLDGCRFNVTEVWFPPVEILNSSNLRIDRTNARNEVAIGPDGNVKWVQRFTGAVSSYHNLRNFPFDSQAFEVEITSLEYGVEDLVFFADTERSSINERLNIEGWGIQGIELTAHETNIEDLDLKTSALRLTIFAEREISYYVYRVIVLLGFVVAMSWTIFWVPPSRFEFQIGLGATSMLTSIAFNLSISSILPKLGYLTVLDKVVVWAIVLIFLSMIESLYTGLLVLREAEQKALRIDRFCRFAFPAALVLGWTVIVASSGF